jgi:hypothetical protein
MRRWPTGYLDTSSGNKVLRATLGKSRVVTGITFSSASLGFEPRQRDPESLVLPLHHEATANRDIRKPNIEFRNKRKNTESFKTGKRVFTRPFLRFRLLRFGLPFEFDLGFPQLPRMSSSPSRAPSTSSSFPPSRISRRASSTIASNVGSS